MQVTEQCMNKKRSNTNRRFAFIAIFAIVVVGVVASLIITLTPSSKVNREMIFLTALLRKDDNTAINYASSNLLAEASTSCPDGLLTNCVIQQINEWGELTEVHFAVGSGSRNTSLYHTFWSNLNAPVSIVIISSEIDGVWQVNGWRGFIPFESESLDSQLLRGIRSYNLFTVP
jgi:hypothetical protein